MKSLLRLFRSLFKDLESLHPGVDGFERDLLTIEARVEDEGVGFVSVALPSLGKVFDQSLAEGRWTHASGFSTSGSLPKFLSGLIGLVFDTKTGSLRDNPPIDAILSIRQVLYLCKKIQTTEKRAKMLDFSTRMSFFANDRSIRPVVSSRLETLKHVSSFLLPDLDESISTNGKHGPGAVCEGLLANQKWIAIDSAISSFDSRLLSIGYDLQAMLRADHIPPESLTNYRSTEQARLVTVPKNSTALRTITVEPVVSQFVQQAYNARLRGSISRCRVLRRSLSLKSQTANQKLAILGSLTGNWCTIDLSSASDLLSLQTVEAVFAHRPLFLKGIMACRTPSVKSGSDTITLKKYAGMGNATTFPVQSVVFVAIALCAIATSTKELNYEKLCRLSRNVRVFGDDIVIRTEHFPAFADWIQSFGLKINRGKTFTKGNFRESCGVDAYGGTDVTPLYLRHDPGSLSLRRASACVSLVSLANRLWLRGYYRAAKYLETRIDGTLRLRRSSLPLVTRRSGALGWHTRQDARSGSYWNPTLHRFEVQTYVTAVKKRPDKLDGMPALLRFFHEAEASTCRRAVGTSTLLKLSFEESQKRFSLSLRKRRVQAS